MVSRILLFCFSLLYLVSMGSRALLCLVLYVSGQAIHAIIDPFAIMSQTNK